MLKPLVIYHADCTDGFAAAFSCWLKLGDAAEYLPMQYNKDTSPDIMAEKCRNREVYILDFSFERKVMEHIFQTAERVVWLDHHKTAFEMWCGDYERGAQHLEGCSAAKNCIILDDLKSGALLAWEYFHPGTEVPVLIRHIDDRDRWQFKLKGSRELHAALWSYRPWNFEQWGHWCGISWELSFNSQNDWRRFLAEGAAILRAQEQNIASMLKQAQKCEIFAKGTEELMQLYNGRRLFPGLALNAPIHQSEIGHELANQSSTYGLVWYMDVGNRVKCSLRSNGEYDVSAIARAFGGGGHRNAAGFEIDIQTLTGWLK